MTKVKKMAVRERVLRTILRHRRNGFHFIDTHHIHTDGLNYVSGDRRLRKLSEDGVVTYTYYRRLKRYDFKKTPAAKIQKELKRLERERGIK